MNLEQLKSLIKQNESEYLEFKKSTGQIRSAFETICGFLNNKGGTVLFGVTDEDKIVGQHVADKTRLDIAAEIARLEPSAQSQLSVKYVPIGDDKNVIAIQARENGHVPYTYDGRPYQRIQSATSRMSQHKYEQLIVQRGQLNHSWEDQSVIGYDVNSLDHNEIKRTIERGVRKNRIPAEALDESIEEILENRFELLENGAIKNAAVVLFAKKVLPAYPQCFIKMARFKGTEELGDFIDSQHIHGNAFQILTAADHFVMRHLSIASFFDEDKFERRDEPALPILALREAFINAVCHKDYSVRSSAIFLSIFDDRLELWNNGTLPLQLKIDDLTKTHKSYPRNEKIADIFYNRGLIETWGKGINKMLKLCEEQNIPPPEFNEYSGGIGVTFRFKESVGIHSKKHTSTERLNSLRQENILSIIEKHNSVNITQIMSELKNPPSRRMVAKDLNNLKKQGLIEIKGRSTSSVWALKKFSSGTS